MSGPTPKQLPDLPDAIERTLQAQAIRGQWSVDDALDWAHLDFAHLAPPIRTAMATVYGDVLFAEAFGVRVIERMIALAPEGWLRDFALTQAQDEQRHAEFFTRVLAKLGGSEERSQELSDLRDELARTTDYDELVMHGQVIETAARVIFVGNGTRTLARMNGAVRLPGTASVTSLLRAVVDLVGRDESRHIAFGLHCLRKRLAGCDAGQRHGMEQRAAISSRLMFRAFARRRREFQTLGWSAADTLERTWHALRVQLGRLDFDIGEMETSGGDKSDGE